MIPFIILSALILTACSPTVPVVPSLPTNVPVEVFNEVEGGLIAEPITDALKRVTKKPFGLKISSNDSPVDTERFSGYHTGVDFETFPEEQESDVSVYAICEGPVVLKRTATGYGGVLIQRCILEGEDITVLYGHLRLSSIPMELNEKLLKGQRIGILGQGYSNETDGERKHLHLGIHKGFSTVLLGYVQEPERLQEWIDPLTLLK
ncbi:M23 family metallopeptidase [Patescibacteria group bacterium]|nr:M23 family metallopeptidase [Patescibacteria group bacterium]